MRTGLLHQLQHAMQNISSGVCIWAQLTSAVSLIFTEMKIDHNSEKDPLNNNGYAKFDQIIRICLTWRLRILVWKLWMKLA